MNIYQKIAGLVILIVAVAGVTYAVVQSKKPIDGAPLTSDTILNSSTQATTTVPKTGTQIHITPGAVSGTSSIKTLEQYTGVASSVDTTNWKTYKDATGYSISYPADFAINTKYVDSSSGKNMPGVAFTVPESFTKGTNLSSDTSIAVVTNPNTTLCDTKLFVPSADVSTAQNTMVGNSIFSLMKGSEGAAGNFYEGIVASPVGTKVCLGIRLFIHSTNISNYPTGTVKAFDRNQLISIFESMVGSYKAK